MKRSFPAAVAMGLVLAGSLVLSGCSRDSGAKETPATAMSQPKSWTTNPSRDQTKEVIEELDKIQFFLIRWMPLIVVGIGIILAGIGLYIAHLLGEVSQRLQEVNTKLGCIHMQLIQYEVRLPR